MNILGKGVYFLFQGERLVYIGQASSIYSRIGAHVKSAKDFDTWECYETPTYTDDELSALETELIRWFSPPYNSTSSSGEPRVYLSKDEYMKAIRGRIKFFEDKSFIPTNENIVRCANCMFWRRTFTNGYGRSATQRSYCPMYLTEGGHTKETDACTYGVPKDYALYTNRGYKLDEAIKQIRRDYKNKMMMRRMGL